MSATAILLRDSGVAVTGSDEAIYPPISQVLAREEFACRAPYAAQNIPDDADRAHKNDVIARTPVVPETVSPGRSDLPHLQLPLTRRSFERIGHPPASD
jgi:UDP-N-acetylmuramate-alanine ligase